VIVPLINRYDGIFYVDNVTVELVFRFSDPRQTNIWDGDTPDSNCRPLRQYGWPIPKIKNKQPA
jgi:hypothetical protein